MKSYRPELEKRARRQLRAIPGRIQCDVTQTILDLRFDPYPEDSKPLRREYRDLRTIRIDGWRIIYKVYEQDRLLRVLAVRPRGPDTYTSIF